MKVWPVNLLTTVLLIAFLFACATPVIHKVDIQNIEANKNKIYKIGIVKVAGDIGILDNLDKKKIALERIPTQDICNTLYTNFGLQVITDFDKTIKIVKEEGGQIPSSSNKPGLSFSVQMNMNFSRGNPYWGNKEYSDPHVLKEVGIIDKDVDNMVYITYSFRKTFSGLKSEFYYEVIVKSDAAVLIHQSNLISVVDTPMRGLIFDTDGFWDNVIYFAAKVNESFIKDINQTR